MAGFITPLTHTVRNPSQIEGATNRNDGGDRGAENSSESEQDGWMDTRSSEVIFSVVRLLELLTEKKDLLY